MGPTLSEELLRGEETERGAGGRKEEEEEEEVTSLGFRRQPQA